jgi:DNA invertase Pin-like site-specific DNA recombinase
VTRGVRELLDRPREVLGECDVIGQAVRRRRSVGSVVLDGYVRVSQLRGRGGERFISPALQREQIEGWIGLRGAGLGAVFEELDVPGAGRERPLLERALARIEAGESDGLVVAHLDRFGRSLLEGLLAIERIQRAGGTFASVNDGFDLATDTGRW